MTPVRRWMPSLIAVCLVAIATNPAPGQAPKRFGVGAIVVAGNARTTEDRVRELLGFVPGQFITDAELRRAERNLVESGLFLVDDVEAIRPTVRAVTNAGNPLFVDIHVAVQERPRDPMVWIYACSGSFVVIVVVLLLALGLYWWSFRSPEPTL